MLKILRENVNAHPFTTVENLHDYIDAWFEKYVKQNGRSTATIQTAKATRASV